MLTLFGMQVDAAGATQEEAAARTACWMAATALVERLAAELGSATGATPVTSALEAAAGQGFLSEERELLSYGAISGPCDWQVGTTHPHTVSG